MQKLLRGTWCLLAVAVMLAGFSVRSEAQTRRALLIGINTYQPEDSKPAVEEATVVATAAARPVGRGTWRNLSGAVNDVEAFRAVLVTRFAFPQENIRIVDDTEATRENILKAIREHLIEPAQEGDVLVFFYAGHGSRVFNSLSPEADRMDETLVPADSYRGTPDIRDKELRRLFNEILDTGALLTVVSDSCHSGGITRGLRGEQVHRNLPPDLRDVADGSDPGPPPAERGAVFLVASRADQLAHESPVETADGQIRPHGEFTKALLRVLRTAPTNAPAGQILDRTRAILQRNGRPQEPNLDGPRDRPLFGRRGEAALGGIQVAALNVFPGYVLLQGGPAAGINQGSELKRVAGDPDEPSVRLRVIETETLVRSRAEVIEGDLADIRPGDLFELEKWTAPDAANLLVWWPPALPDAEALQRAATAFAPLQTSDRITWVEDPTTGPTHVVEWDGERWVLLFPDGTQRPLGPQPTAASVLKGLEAETAKSAEEIRLFVYLPAVGQFVDQLQVGRGTPNDAIETGVGRQSAHYLLVGRLRGSAVDYAWVLASATQTMSGQEQPQTSALPATTRWHAAPTEPAAFGPLAAQLRDYALRLAKIRGWLQLEAPPDSGRFPYQLAFERASTGELDEGPFYDGERYTMVLLGDEDVLQDHALTLEQRYVYVFGIDQEGRSSLLFPSERGGNLGNFLPPPDKERVSRPAKIPLLLSGGADFSFYIRPPFGMDTFVLLATAEAIHDLSVFTHEGVRDLVATRGRPSPLEQLLSRVGVRTRAASAPPPPVPANWSIQRVTVESREKSPQ